MASCNLVITVKFKWWYTWLYLPMIICMAKLIDFADGWPELNGKRFEYWTRKGMVIKSGRNK
jgi:hypothetical protein